MQAPQAASPEFDIRNICLSADKKYFVCACNYGFCVYDLKFSRSDAGNINLIYFKRLTPEDSKVEKDKNNFIDGLGCKFAEMYSDPNIIAVTGDAFNRYQLSHVVYIWNCERNEFIKEIPQVEDINGLRMAEKYLLVSTPSALNIYGVNHFLLKQIKTNNPRGIFSLENDYLALPDKENGYVQVISLSSGIETRFKVHTSGLSALTLMSSGSNMFTTSNRGTLIRKYTSFTGQKVHEFRRGIEPSLIYNLILDSRNKHLLVTSAKGTAHLFKLEQTNTTSWLNFSYNFAYFQSEWSSISFQCPTEKHVCFFHPNAHNIVFFTLLGKCLVYDLQGKLVAAENFHQNPFD